MTGLEEFKELFGNITVLNVIELLLAVAFLVFLYKKAKDYLTQRYEATKLKDEQLKTALDAVSQYPNIGSRASESSRSWRAKSVS